MTTRYVLAMLTALAGATGCADGSDGNPSPGGIGVLGDQDLGLGARGEAVVAAHHYLAGFGYLPNPELQQRYPRWRPITPDSPADVSVYDQHSAAAVEALQATYSLPVTGIVDRATRALMRQPRCGVPDGIPPRDPSEKFTETGQRWSETSVSWQLINNSSFSFQLVHDAVWNSFATWHDASGELFPETGATPDITISFGHPHLGNAAAAETTPPNDGGDVLLNIDMPFTFDSSGLDMQTVLTHEIGHALGLDHSGIAQAVMSVTGTRFRRNLEADDAAAISLYNTYFTLPGKGRDIGVSTGPDRAVWIISDEPWGSGYRVKRWNGALENWDPTDGGAVRVAVGPDGVPWLVDSEGKIWRRTTSDPGPAGAWEQLPCGGRAMDIAVGGNGDVWVVGTDNRIYKWNGSCWTGTPDGAAVRIAVDEIGIPWVINTANIYFRRTTSDPAAANAWARLPATQGIPLDIAAGVGGEGRHAWAFTASSSRTVGLSVWNEQHAIPNRHDIPELARWELFRMAGAGGPLISGTVDASGRPWFIDGNGAILTARR